MASLDLLRGLAVAGMIAVNAAAYLHYAAKLPVLPWLMHAPWAGFTVADAVFPAFITLTGVSIPIAAARARPAVRRLVARSARLFLAGVIVGNLFWLGDFAAHDFRPFGVLQRIAIVYLACALLHRAFGPRTLAAIAAVLLLIGWGLILLPFADGVTDLGVPGLNWIAWVDRVVLGDHRFVKGAMGFDPEGIVSTLPAIAQALLGVLACEWLLRRPGVDGARQLGLAGLVMTIAGLAWSPVLPIIKSMWTSSFVLLSAGVTFLMLAGLRRVTDLRGSRMPFQSGLEAFGRNAIFAYLLHMVATLALTADLFVRPYTIAAQVLPGSIAALVPVALFLWLMWLPVRYLQRRGWTISI